MRKANNDEYEFLVIVRSKDKTETKIRSKVNKADCEESARRAMIGKHVSNGNTVISIERVDRRTENSI